MFWKKTLAPVVIAAAVTLGGASVAAASDAPGEAPEFHIASAEVTGTALPSNAGPDAICANATSNPALGVLCPLWTAHTLNDRSHQMLGVLIVRVANGGAETPKPTGTPRAARTPNPNKAERIERREDGRAKFVADCTKYLAEHPDATDARAKFCKDVVARASSTATPTTSATPSGTSTARGFLRPNHGQHEGSRGLAGARARGPKGTQ